MICLSISLSRLIWTRGLRATRRSRISRNHPSGSLRTQVSEEEAGNVGALEQLEYYLKLAKDTTEGTQKMSNSLKFNIEQCEYLVDKLEVVLKSASSFLEVSRGKLHGSILSEGGMGLVELFKLVVALARQTESFFKGCCKDAWIQAAMTLTIVSEYVSSLGFNMELCRVALCKNCAAIGCLALGEVANINRAETEIVEKKAEVDLRSLVRKVTLELNSLCGEERDLASYLLQRLLRVGSNPTSEDGSRLGKLFDWVIPGEQLGRGASAVVHKAMWLGTPVAKKTFDGADNSDFMKEVEILSQLCHPNITSMFCSSKNLRKCSIIMELMDEDLDRLMQRRCQRSDSPPFSILEAVGIMLQIGEGVNYLHSQGIVHRDLKSMNILVTNVIVENIETGYVHAKVADFGLSKTKERSTTYSNQSLNVGSTRWMPPEIMELRMENEGHSRWSLKTEKLPNYPFKCDTYSFGMVCYEILTGHVPFSNNNNPNDVKKRVLKDRERPDLPSDCLLKLKALIEKCWAHEPKERPKFGVICEELKYLKYLLLSAESKEDRNGSRETDSYHIRAPPPGSYQDDDTGSSPKNLVMAVMGVKSAVNHFAKALISDMNKYPEELRYLKLRIRKEVHGEVDSANHWKFLVQAFVCKRLFEGFETENGFFGIEYFDELKTSSASSFNDFSAFKDKAGTISLLLAKDSADLSFLGKFCFKKFKSISGGSVSNQPLPFYDEEWSMIERE